MQHVLLREVDESYPNELSPSEIAVFISEKKAKAFDHSAVIGRFISLADLPKKNEVSFSLSLNKNEVQQGVSNQMLFSIDQIIAYVSGFITLKTGDLIYTGTPAGVGPVKIGDRLEAKIENEVLLDFEIK
jgi:2-keto-4-pentenoate hydratase/2-oxohepta-3-ene-1,7-dioic acid hydratase in catechol pathway